ncbi:MAG: CoA pyrophosphatase [Deltaproteobacteria bacterium]|nr:MAG: CoA pyrophosphatase [Deltaproteobacteria bacterium]
MTPLELKKKLRRALFGYGTQRVARKGLRRAAVLVPLLLKEGSLHVLLIKRSAGLPQHAGEIAFPGGRVEPRDASPRETALREAFEEVGLDPRDVEIVGRLNEVVTRTRFLVTPFVGIVPYPYPFRADGREAERLLLLPLECFGREKATERPWGGQKVLFYHLGPHTVWGATAQILTELVELLTSSRILCTR